MITYNLPQLLLAVAPQRVKFLEGGRGIGKSTSVAKEVEDVVFDMPRSNNGIIGKTYKDILTRTLPSTIAGLERLELYKDRDFFVGRRAPRKLNWPEPVQPPGDYSHAIHFFNGTVYNLISQDRSGRGLNLDSVIGDEMQDLDYEKLGVHVAATNRGSDKRFKHCKKFRNELYVGTTPLLQSGKWLYKMEQNARLTPEEIFYLRADSTWNKEILGDAWFRDMKRMLPSWLYDAEIMNIRPSQISDGFYPSLNQKHFYTNYNYDYYDGLEFDVKIESINSLGDHDCNPNIPLEISVDWGAALNSMTVWQEGGDKFDFQCINEFFVKGEDHKILDDLFIEKFIPYYQHHRHKNVYFWYDRNGNNSVANSKLTFYEQAENLLRQAGWNVIPMSYGLDPYHDDKYLVINLLLKGGNRLPTIGFNRGNCKYTIISMQNAPAKELKGIKKDKGSERKKGFAQEEATHLSDTIDIILYGKYKSLTENKVGYVGNMFR